MRTCTFEGCDEPQRANGYCHTHYEQNRKGRVLAPIQIKYGTKSEKDTTCNNDGCLNPRFMDRGRLLSRCMPCNLLRRYYGLDFMATQEMWASQDRKCACCRGEGPDVYLPCVGWVIDHDHSCCPEKKTCGKCIRGIVCHACNTGPLRAHVTKEVWESTGRYLGYV